MSWFNKKRCKRIKHLECSLKEKITEVNHLRNEISSLQCSNDSLIDNLEELTPLLKKSREKVSKQIEQIEHSEGKNYTLFNKLCISLFFNAFFIISLYL